MFLLLLQPDSDWTFAGAVRAPREEVLPHTQVRWTPHPCHSDLLRASRPSISCASPVPTPRHTCAHTQRHVCTCTRLAGSACWAAHGFHPQLWDCQGIQTFLWVPFLQSSRRDSSVFPWGGVPTPRAFVHVCALSGDKVVVMNLNNFKMTTNSPLQGRFPKGWYSLPALCKLLWAPLLESTWRKEEANS